MEKMEEKAKNEYSFSFLKPILLLAGLFLFLFLLKINDTFSLFSDQVKIEGITFSAADNFFPVGAVVINEVMWMGSAEDPKDEWIELKNNTDEEVDLSGWNIQSGGKGKKGHIEIPHGYSIKADGYFLLLRKKWDESSINLEDKPDKDDGLVHISGMDLDDDGEQLILTNKNKNGLVIDIAGKEDEKWLAGEDGEGSGMSMQRKDAEEDGTKEDNWQTCREEECAGDEYWKITEGEAGLNFGTPGGENIF